MNTNLFLQNPRIGRISLALAAIIFLSTPLLTFRSITHMAVDFKTVYSSAKCLIDGRDPYDHRDLLEEYTRSGGDVSLASDLGAFKPFQALYPPSSLFLVTPFTFLPFNTALALWLVFSGALFITATYAVANLVEDWGGLLPVLLLALFLATSMMLLITAQPSGPAISLCVIGVWSLLRGRFPLMGAICFALSLVLKPQTGGLVLVYFLLARGPFRRRAWATLVLAGLLCLPGLWVASHNPGAAHWPQKVSRNIEGSSVPGSMNDPRLLSPNSQLIADLQPVIAIFTEDPHVYNTVAEAIGGSLLLLCFWVAWRGEPSVRKDLLGVAAVACLSLLPMYHRNYDVRLLLLTFPAAAMLIVEGGIAGVAAILLALVATFGSHSDFIGIHIMPHLGKPAKWKELLLMRTTPLGVLVTGLFYLVLSARAARQGASSRLAAEGSRTPAQAA